MAYKMLSIKDSYPGIKQSHCWSILLFHCRTSIHTVPGWLWQDLNFRPGNWSKKCFVVTRKGKWKVCLLVFYFIFVLRLSLGAATRGFAACALLPSRVRSRARVIFVHKQTNQLIGISMIIAICWMNITTMTALAAQAAQTELVHCTVTGYLISTLVQFISRYEEGWRKSRDPQVVEGGVQARHWRRKQSTVCNSAATLFHWGCYTGWIVCYVYLNIC